MALFIRLTLTLTVVALLTACGTNKSNTTATSSSILTATTAQSLALCNKSVDSNFSFNVAAVTDSNGNISADYIKMKFNFINSSITKSGNVIKFFKWKVVGSQSVLDSTPLNVYTYDFSTGQTNSNAANSIAADQFTGTNGLYIQLNDPTSTYQVIKAVAYDSTGAVIANLNSLIPVFAANPSEYAYNSDGSVRSTTLQQMHALYGKTTGYTAASQYKAYFDQYCF